MAEDLLVCQLGAVPYDRALAWQRALRDRVVAGGEEVVLVLEHPPTYTLGRRSEPGDLPMGEDWYRAQGIELHRVDRGGKLTYHGPGQLVAYPIVRVERIPAFVAALERALVAALAEEGIEARGRDDEGPAWTGVWTPEDRKIASIGIHRSRGVSTHGLALNVDNDLQPFEWVVACGLPETRMTSVCRELGVTGRLPCLRKRVAFHLCRELGRRQRLVSQRRLLDQMGDSTGIVVAGAGMMIDPTRPADSSPAGRGPWNSGPARMAESDRPPRACGRETMESPI